MVNCSKMYTHETVYNGHSVRTSISKVTVYDSSSLEPHKFVNIHVPVYSFEDGVPWHKVEDIAQAYKDTYQHKEDKLVLIYKLSGDNNVYAIDQRPGEGWHDPALPGSRFVDGQIVPLKKEFILKGTNHVYITVVDWPTAVLFKVWYAPGNRYLNVTLDSGHLTVQDLKNGLVRMMGYTLNPGDIPDEYLDQLVIYKCTNNVHDFKALPNQANLHYDPVPSKKRRRRTRLLRRCHRR